jgi:hypothetical protein
MTLLALAALAAATPSFEIVARMSLEHGQPAPDFFHMSWEAPTYLDRDQLIWVGREHHDGTPVSTHKGLYFYDLRKKELQRADVPMPAGLFLERPLCWDTEHGVASLLAADSSAPTSKNFFYVELDLRANQIGRRVAIGSYGNWIHPLAYQPETRTCFFYSATGSNLAVMVVDERPRKIAAVTLSPQGKVFYDPLHHRAAFVEYAERGMGKAEAQLLDLAAATLSKPFAIPEVNYGVAFDPDGTTTYHYGAKPGQLWAIDVATGEKKKANQVKTLGHPLGLVDAETLGLVRNDAIDFFDRTTLARRGSIPMKTIDPTIALIEGSRVFIGRIVLRASHGGGKGMELLVLDLSTDGQRASSSKKP